MIHGDVVSDVPDIRFVGILFELILESLWARFHVVARLEYIEHITRNILLSAFNFDFSFANRAGLGPS